MRAWGCGVWELQYYVYILFCFFYANLFVDLIKRGVLTLVGEIRRYRNDFYYTEDEEEDTRKECASLGQKCPFETHDTKSDILKLYATTRGDTIRLYVLYVLVTGLRSAHQLICKLRSLIILGQTLP